MYEIYPDVSYKRDLDVTGSMIYTAELIRWHEHLHSFMPSPYGCQAYYLVLWIVLITLS